MLRRTPPVLPKHRHTGITGVCGVLGAKTFRPSASSSQTRTPHLAQCPSLSVEPEHRTETLHTQSPACSPIPRPMPGTMPKVATAIALHFTFTIHQFWGFASRSRRHLSDQFRFTITIPISPSPHDYVFTPVTDPANSPRTRRQHWCAPALPKAGHARPSSALPPAAAAAQLSSPAKPQARRGTPGIRIQSPHMPKLLTWW